jgi:hypothetical protein
LSIIGSLEDLSLADIFQILAGSQKSGVLYVNTVDGRSSIAFNNGYVVSASRPDLSHRLGQLLLKQNIISRLDLETCLTEQSRTGLPLGELLLKRQLIAPEVLRGVMRQQVVETLKEIVNLEEGSFSFQTDTSLPSDLVLLDPQHILLDVAYLQDTSGLRGKSSSEEPFSPSKLISEIGADDSSPGLERSDFSEDLRSIKLVREISEELARPRESTEVSLLILRLASEFFDRSLFFVVAGDRLISCGGFGFPLCGGTTQQGPYRVSIPLKDASIFKSVFETGQTYRGVLLEGEWGKGLIARITRRLPNEIVVVPIVSQEVVIALLYGDNGESQQRMRSTDLLEVLTLQAGMALENTVLRNKLLQLTAVHGDPS